MAHVLLFESYCCKGRCPSQCHLCSGTAIKYAARLFLDNIVAKWVGWLSSVQDERLISSSVCSFVVVPLVVNRIVDGSVSWSVGQSNG
jgi:hypothetical protein